MSEVFKTGKEWLSYVWWAFINPNDEWVRQAERKRIRAAQQLRRQVKRDLRQIGLT